MAVSSDLKPNDRYSQLLHRDTKFKAVVTEKSHVKIPTDMPHVWQYSSNRGIGHCSCTHGKLVEKKAHIEISITIRVLSNR